MTNDDIGDYSQVAADQLDKLDSTASDDLWNGIMDAVDLIFRIPAEAQKRSAAIRERNGDIVFRIAVVGQHPYKVFWKQTADGPRIEAVFPYDN